LLTIAALAFVCTAVAIGTLISTFAQNQQQSMLGGFLFCPGDSAFGAHVSDREHAGCLEMMSDLNP